MRQVLLIASHSWLRIQLRPAPIRLVQFNRFAHKQWENAQVCQATLLTTHKYISFKQIF